MTGSAAPVLQMRDIWKSYGHVVALQGVDLELARGETLALVGDNGAGKSTLMKVLAGVVRPDKGRVTMDGVETAFADPDDARRAGIEMVFQDLALFEDGDIAWNVFAGRELVKRRSRSLDDRAMRRRTAELLAGLGVDLGPVTTSVRMLSGGQRQMVAIARAVAFSDARSVIVLDEPTAALGQVESGAVHDLILTLRAQGVPIVLISHRIPEVLELADRLVVLRRGEVVGIRPTDGTSVEAVVDLIVAGRRAPRRGRDQAGEREEGTE